MRVKIVFKWRIRQQRTRRGTGSDSVRFDPAGVVVVAIVVATGVVVVVIVDATVVVVVVLDIVIVVSGLIVVVVVAQKFQASEGEGRR